MPRLTGLPSLKICLRTNQHPGFRFPGHTDDIFFLLDWEDLTFANPGVCFWASIVNFVFIRSFTICDGCLVDFSFLLWGSGFVHRFIQAILGDVALFVAGETVPFFAKLFHIFWGCGTSSSLGSTVSIHRTVPISSCVHGVWIR